MWKRIFPALRGAGRAMGWLGVTQRKQEIKNILKTGD